MLTASRWSGDADCGSAGMAGGRSGYPPPTPGGAGRAVFARLEEQIVPDSPNCPPGPPAPDPAERQLASYARVHEALLDLAYDVSSYLRHHARPGVRIAAALLLAGSLAACGGSSASAPISNVAPLQQEVRLGLPPAPGRYAVIDGTLGRDVQGVYHFAWRRPDEPATARHPASVSRIRLGQAPTPSLEVPAQGDPILYLPANAGIPLVSSAGDLLTPTPGGGYGARSYWYPFWGSSYRGIGYYDPPVRTSTGGSINGATMSSSPRSFAERTVGLSRAVSGRAGGTGSGTAATAKSGASFSSSHGGAAAAKAGSFSAGGGSSARGSSS